MSATENAPGRDDGASAVLTDPGGPGSRQRWHPTLVLVVIVAVAAMRVGVTSDDEADPVAVDSQSDDNTPDDDTPDDDTPDDDTPDDRATDATGDVDPDVIRDAQEQWRSQIAEGWVPYGLSTVEGIDAELKASEAWVRVDENGFPVPDPDPTGGLRTPVHDRPDGAIVGYEYAEIGFVERAVAESGTFDVGAAIAALDATNLEKYGCDIHDDIECWQAYLREKHGPGVVPG